MKSSSQSPRPRSVLIVDDCEDAREVLGTALRRRGVVTIEAARGRQALELALQLQPDLVVLDMEADSTDADSIDGESDDDFASHNGPVIVLGTARQGSTTGSHTRFIRKPYHYAPLIRTIEQMLEN